MSAIPIRAPPAQSAPWPLRGHPTGLAVVVLTGMWEVFALFGMRCVLVFYLVKDLGFRPAAAVEIYSLSTAAAMGMSLVGAVVADRVMGVRRAVVAGALGMAAGHLMLVVPQLLFPALLLITLANGLFKPSLVSQMNRLYDPDDPFRDRAFTVYKAGCNGAAIFAPLVMGLVGEAYGWSRALAVCGVGMVIASATFVAGRRYLIESPKATVGEAASDAGASQRSAYLGRLLVVLVGSICFWTAHGQQGGTIALWVDGAVDRVVTLLGYKFEVPATWFQSVNPIIIVSCTPIINWWWSRRDAADRGVSELRRMALGGTLLSTSFLILAVASYSHSGRPVPSAWLFGALFLLTLGELYFDALGQAFVLRLASLRNMTIFVSLWFLTLAAGFGGAGWLGRAWGCLNVPAYFTLVAGIAALAAVFVLSASQGRTHEQG